MKKNQKMELDQKSKITFSKKFPSPAPSETYPLRKFKRNSSLEPKCQPIIKQSPGSLTPSEKIFENIRAIQIPAATLTLRKRPRRRRDKGVREKRGMRIRKWEESRNMMA